MNEPSAVIERDAWLAKHIQEHGGTALLAELAKVFDGLTTIEDRRERFRKAILANGFSSVLVNWHNGKNETYAQIFERWYGQPL